MIFMDKSNLLIILKKKTKTNIILWAFRICNLFIKNDRNNKMEK